MTEYLYETPRLQGPEISIAENMPQGSVSEASKASSEGGRRYHEHLVDRLTQVIATLRRKSP